MTIPQLDLQQKPQDQAISSYWNMYTIQSRWPKTEKALKIAQIYILQKY
jgi:hypothetical protein